MADKTIQIRLAKGLAGCTKAQLAVVESLGLRKIGDVTTQPASPATEGKITKVSHLLEVTR